MADGQSDFSEPMTMQEALAKADSLTRAKEAEAVEPAQGQEEETDESVEVEAEAETDEPEQEEPQDEGEESDQILTADEYGDVLVDVDGEPTPLKDVLAGTLRQSDYTRKTQALKDQEKALRAELDEREKALDAREQELAALAAETVEQEPDWEALAEEDPLGWASAKAKWEKKQKAQEQRKVEATKKQEKARREFMARTAEIAVSQIPEWSDPQAFAASADARKKAALDAGFSETEYNSTPDYRIAVLLEKAARFDAMQAGTKKKVVAAEKKISRAPKVLKPGQSRGDSDPKQERRQAFQKRLSKPTTSAEISRMLGLR